MSVACRSRLSEMSVRALSEGQTALHNYESTRSSSVSKKGMQCAMRLSTTKYDSENRPSASRVPESYLGKHAANARLNLRCLEISGLAGLWANLPQPPAPLSNCSAKASSFLKLGISCLPRYSRVSRRSTSVPTLKAHSIYAIRLALRNCDAPRNVADRAITRSHPRILATLLCMDQRLRVCGFGYQHGLQHSQATR
jgi:hypothetical protein